MTQQSVCSVHWCPLHGRPEGLVTYEKSGGVRIDLKRYLRWFLPRRRGIPLEKFEALHEQWRRQWPCESLEAGMAECITLLHEAAWFGRKLSAVELVAIESTMMILREKVTP